MASGDTLLTLFAQDAVLPPANAAQRDTVLATGPTPDITIPVLDFDSTADEYADWKCAMPSYYAGTTGITLTFVWMGVPTTGTVAWAAQIRSEGNADAGVTKDFAAAVVASADTVEGTASNLNYTTLAMTDGAQIDSVAVSESFTLRVYRDISADDMAGDAELVAIIVKET